MPSVRPNSRSLRSFSVIAESGSTTPGTLTPLRSESGPPLTTARLGEVRAAALDAQAHAGRRRAKGPCPRLERGEDLRMRQCGARLVARLVAVEVEPERCSRFELDRPVGEGANAQLRALQIEQHADRPAQIALDRADDVQTLLVVVVRSVAEVEPEDVGAGVEQRFDGFAIRARRARGSRRSWHCGYGACQCSWSVLSLRRFRR